MGCDMTIPSLPQYHELIFPAIRAVESLGGSGSISEIVETVIKMEGFTDDQQAVLHNNGPDSEIGYRLAWARTYLKGMGLLTNSARGVWALTEEGSRFLGDQSLNDKDRKRRIADLRAAYVKSQAVTRASRRAATDVVGGGGEDEPANSGMEGADGWKEQLIATMTSPLFSAASFERLTQRLLREADPRASLSQVAAGTRD